MAVLKVTKKKKYLLVCYVLRPQNLRGGTNTFNSHPPKKKKQEKKKIQLAFGPPTTAKTFLAITLFLIFFSFWYLVKKQT